MKKETLAAYLVAGIPVLLCGITLSPFVAFAETPQSSCPFAWNTDLRLGSIGNDVFILQKFLNSDPTTLISSSGTGSIGQETKHFGALTKTAVVKFQEKYASDILIPNGLTKGTGIVGGSTRAKLNSLCSLPAASPESVSKTVPAISTGDFLKVESSGDQPTAGIAPSNALYVPFTRVKLSAGAHDVTITSMTVKRVGPAVDQDFSNVDLLDEDGSEISYAYLRSDHRTVFKDSFVIPAGTSKVVTLAGDMANLTDHNGESAGLQLESVEADVTVTPFVPIGGTFQTMNSTLAIGTVTATLSPDDPRGDRTRYITDTNVIFSGVRITVGSGEQTRLDSITWEQTGTAGTNDIANVATVVDGVSYPAERDGRFYTSTFPNGIFIDKGNSLDLAVKGDLGTTGSNRTVKFDIYYASDIYVTGTMYGFGIYTTPEDHTDTSGNSVFLTLDGTTDTESANPFFSGSVVTISPGAMTSIGKN